jgi:hypothetical protein
MRELAVWRLNSLSWTKSEEGWYWLSETHPEIFLYRFKSGGVDVVQKPRNLAISDWNLRRVAHYLNFFEGVAEILPVDYEAMLALAIGDNNQLEIHAPIFSFQKIRGGKEVLLPDIDFLINDFYRNSEYNDHLSYTEKLNHAIFVGSTTGGTVTPEIARDCGLPRLASARFFSGNERVKFLLPSIVQCSSPEAQKILEQIEFCQHPRVSWREQIKHKFLISIDGNGAACSRMVLSLKSNSILLKYNSDHVLYYFDALEPWVQYIPVHQNSDIEQLIDREALSPETFASVARNGRDFAEAFLTKEAVTSYMAELLLTYRDCFTGPGPSFDRPGIKRAGVIRHLYRQRAKDRLRRYFPGWQQA